MDRRAFLGSSLILLSLPASAQGKKRVVTLAPKPRLAATLDLYVDCRYGNDAFDGLSWQTAKRTMQNAYEFGHKEFDMNKVGMRIYLADSGDQTYAPLNAVGALTTAHIFSVIGNRAAPHACRVHAPDGQACFWFQDYAGGTVAGVYLTGGANSSGISGRQFALIDYDNVAFGTMGGSHVEVADLSIASCVGPEIIYGGAAQHWNCSANSRLNLGNSTVTIPSPVSFTYFLACQSNSFVSGSPSFVGAGVAGVAGKPLLVQMNATVLSPMPPGNLPSLIQYNGIKL